MTDFDADIIGEPIRVAEHRQFVDLDVTAFYPEFGVVAGRHVVFQAYPDTVSDLHIQVQVGHRQVETGQRGRSGVFCFHDAVQEVFISRVGG